MVHLKLLGGAAVEDESGRRSTLAARRHPLALLALLATAPSATLSRSKLVGLLWPEAREKTARNRLTSCVYEVRSAIGEEVLITSGDDLRLNREVVGCDVWRFLEAMGAEDFDGAVALYGGPFLDGFYLGGSPEFESWVDRERDRLRRNYLAALEALATAAGERGESEAAARRWREWAAEDPYDSRVAARLVDALAAAGNRAEALRVAGAHARLLDEEFGAEPDAGFRASVERLRRAAAGGDREDGGASPGAELPVRSIAVLPFSNLSGTADAEPFAAGLHDDLLTELSRISALRVIARTSVLRYRDTDRPIREIARELGVGTIVEGGVQSAGGRLRLNVQLIDARSGAHRWVERYDRELSTSSIFDIQSELAGRIAASLRAELTTREKDEISMKQSGDLEAYRLYAQGRRLLDQRTVAPMRQAASYFDQAIERDPGYALAWVGISDALSLLYDYGFESADRVLPRAEKSVRHALELDEGLAEAHASLGLLHSNRREGPASVRELQRAVQLRPGYADAHNWLSWIFQCLGERESALESAKRAVELNPLSQEAVSNLSVSFLGNGDAVMALREARRLRELEPTWSTGAFYEALALIGLCRFEEAKPVLEGISVSWVGPGPLGALALAHAASGDRDRAREMLAEFETGGDTFSAGLVHAALDEVEEAFAAFQRVENWGDYWPTLAVHLYFEDVMSPLRADPRFDEIVRKLRHSWGVEIQNGENPKIPG